MISNKSHISEKKKKSRLRPREEDIRGPYFRDLTAIIHSQAFRRLKKKTQVFFSPENDHICTRIEHSLHVSTIAATIAKALNLDPELSQAIGLGHDLGHAPFGHRGEEILREITDINFLHELHSLRVVDDLESYGEGLNLTYAVRDGIAAHCGEKDEQIVEIATPHNDLSNLNTLPSSPSTLEGCIVRLSDSIAYLGRDLEDAIKADLIQKNDIPDDIRNKLGTTNSDIINSLVFDVIDWSDKNGKIGFSREKFKLVENLKSFSRNEIYDSDKMQYWNDYSGFVIKTLYNYLNKYFKKYQFDYAAYKNSSSPLVKKFGKFIEALQNLYEENSFDRIICDYIAGMTDNYALNCFENILSSGTSGL